MAADGALVVSQGVRAAASIPAAGRGRVCPALGTGLACPSALAGGEAGRVLRQLLMILFS